MADLIAQGEHPNDRWRRALPIGQTLMLGRTANPWCVPWDDRISRDHARLLWDGDTLSIEQVAEAKNPIFVRGQAVASANLSAGHHFVIGKTTFSILEDRIALTLDLPEPYQEQAFSAQYLHRLRFRNPDLRIENLARLPELITSASNDNELCQRLANVLLTGIPVADGVAIVEHQSAVSSKSGELVVRHWDRRLQTGGEFRPSERLIRASLARGETLLHIWQSSEQPGYTMMENCDWACCLPVPGEACRGWAIYLAGRLSQASLGAAPSDPTDLRDDLKFSEIVAATLGSLRELRVLNRRQARLAPFFSPRVRELLASDDSESLLAPREAELTVLFCDLRGFSRHSEQHADALLALLERVGQALGVMSRNILGQGGVVADFQGDSAMGFWGWPLTQPARVKQACEAALAIRHEFMTAASESAHPLRDFQVGIGIASGRGVAGKIGSSDQVQVTVFGPVVNLAQRLVSLSKQAAAEIVLDETTAEMVSMADLPGTRLRRIARLRPLGMDQPVEAFELLLVTDERKPHQFHFLVSYQLALEAFEKRDWPRCRELLLALPQDLGWRRIMLEYIERQKTPPQGWEGVIDLDRK
jgi:adenylate cyclase